MEYTRKIVTEDGKEYYGYGFGSDVERVCELVFNTSMVGYQEIISDPSYTYQAVVMSYPLIGNYGIADDDYESDGAKLGALIVREYTDEPSNFRAKETLDAVLKRYDIPGIEGVDTRMIVRSIRNLGSRKVLITSADKDLKTCLDIINRTEIKKDAVSTVSSKEKKEYPANKNKFINIVAIDCGMKSNIVRRMQDKGLNVTVVPYNTSAEEILGLKPDGVFISNGPGDPTDVPETIETVKKLHSKVPIFGICLGLQILALSYGAKTYKLKFGHRGGNHPVKNLKTGKIEITSQNHSYAVKEDSIIDDTLKVTHINLLDNTIEGIECEKDFAFAVQYHPESAPGPQDSDYLFDVFVENIMRFNKINA